VVFLIEFPIKIILQKDEIALNQQNIIKVNLQKFVISFDDKTDQRH